MDPFSSESELLPLHNAFHTGHHSAVLATDTSHLTPTNTLAARIYALRSRIALGHAADVAVELEGESAVPDLRAVRAFAEYSLGDKGAALEEIEELVKTQGGNTTVIVLAATVLQGEGRSEEALKVLRGHQGSLEAVALSVQIHLSLNRHDLAQKEITTAKRWAQDSLLHNLSESWLNLRLGGEAYQSAYYVYEELAQAPSTATARTLIGQAVAELHLGRVEEAEVALLQALQKDAGDPEALANLVVAETLLGRGEEALVRGRELRGVDRGHPMVLDLEARAEAFGRAAAKYKPRVKA